MIKVGFHPAIWIKDNQMENFARALDDMSLTGWDGFEIAGSWAEDYYGNIETFKRLLQMHDLEVSSYYTPLDFTSSWTEEQARIKRRLDFLDQVGSSVLLLDGGKKEGYQVDDDRVKAMAERTNQVGLLCSKMGFKTAWHQHWGTVFECEKIFERFMELTDPELVGFCPDTAHLQICGFNVVETVKRYRHRIQYVHFKDIHDSRLTKENNPYQEFGFVELGQGILDFISIFEILKQVDYSGWIVVDLDYTILPTRKSSYINRKYLYEELGLVGRRNFSN